MPHESPRIIPRTERPSHRHGLVLQRRLATEPVSPPVRRRGMRLRVWGAGGALVLVLSMPSLAAALEANTYKVKSGDTLSTVAAATGLSPARLATLNNLANPDLILAGQELRVLDSATPPSGMTIASTGGPAPLANPTEHLVQAGDTLTGIAAQFGVSPQALADLNELADTHRLSVGQKLKLPPGAKRATPSPTPSPLGSPTARPSGTPVAVTPAELQARVLAEARRVGGERLRVGVFAKHLGTGETIGVRAADAFASASVIKLPILVELERQIAAGTHTKADTLRAQAAQMITVSDNMATNKVYDAVTPKRVNETMTSLGLKDTRLLNKFDDARSRANPGQNATTPADMARLLELIATDGVVSPAVSGDIRGLLERNADRSKLVRSLPTGTRVAHKSGWYDGVANDVGIVTTARGTRWVIAVFAENLDSAEKGNQVIAAISKAVYDGWGRD